MSMLPKSLSLVARAQVLLGRAVARWQVASVPSDAQEVVNNKLLAQDSSEHHRHGMSNKWRTEVHVGPQKL